MRLIFYPLLPLKSWNTAMGDGRCCGRCSTLKDRSWRSCRPQLEMDILRHQRKVTRLPDHVGGCPSSPIQGLSGKAGLSKETTTYRHDRSASSNKYQVVLLQYLAMSAQGDCGSMSTVMR